MIACKDPVEVVRSCTQKLRKSLIAPPQIPIISIGSTRQLLAAYQPVNRESPSATDKQSHSHQKKCQGILDAALLSRTARQEKAMLRMRFDHRDTDKKGQPQCKRPREEPDKKGEAAEKFDEQPQRADGNRYALSVAPVSQMRFQTATTVPTEDLLCRMEEKRNGKTEAQKYK